MNVYKLTEHKKELVEHRRFLRRQAARKAAKTRARRYGKEKRWTNPAGTLFHLVPREKLKVKTIDLDEFAARVFLEAR